MTELKSFLCEIDNAIDAKKNPEGLGWINEISNAISKVDKDNGNMNMYKKFSRKYKVHTQGANEFRTYGKHWKDLVLDGFLLECVL